MFSNPLVREGYSALFYIIMWEYWWFQFNLMTCWNNLSRLKSFWMMIDDKVIILISGGRFYQYFKSVLIKKAKTKSVTPFKIQESFVLIGTICAPDSLETKKYISIYFHQVTSIITMYLTRFEFLTCSWWMNNMTHNVIITSTYASLRTSLLSSI